MSNTTHQVANQPPKALGTRAPTLHRGSMHGNAVRFQVNDVDDPLWPLAESSAATRESNPTRAMPVRLARAPASPVWSHADLSRTPAAAHLATLQLASRLLRRRTLPAAPTIGLATEYWQAIKVAEAALHKERHERMTDVWARLLPVPGPPIKNAADLAQRLLKANDDAHELARLLAHVAGAPRNPEHLFKSLTQGRHGDLRKTPHRLVRRLARWQGLHEIDEADLDALRESLADAEQDLLEDQRHREAVSTSQHIEDAARACGAPRAFVDTYRELAHGELDFNQLLRKLIERFGADMLRSVYQTMIEALGAEIRSQPTVSNREDQQRLHSAMKTASQMSQVQWALEKSQALIGLLQRLNTSRAAA